LSERKGGKIYNTLSVFDPRGRLVSRYRKVHLFNPPPVNEGDCITAGRELVLVDIGGFKCGLMICYDLRFPEMARSLALKGAEVILIASAWPFPRSEHWQILLRARAIENQCYVLAANRTGTDAGSTFCGSSSAIDPYGMALGVAAPDRSQLVIADIDRATLDWTRAKMPVFGDRRPDVYRLGN
jgi:omega-amidase